MSEEDSKSQAEDERNYDFDEDEDNELEKDDNENDDEPKEVFEPPKSADFMAMVENEMEFMNEEWTWPEDKPDEDDNEGEDDGDEDDDANEEPYLKFRRLARAVRMLINVCHVCKGLLCNSVAQENWFALLDNINAAATLQQSQKKKRAFVTLVPNENRQLVQLTFDVNDYKANKQTDELLTDEFRNIMRKPPGSRTPDEIAEAVTIMKGISKAFREYPLNIKKDICQRSFFDTYGHNRVLLKRGLPPDGIYFILRGTLIEKPDAKRNPEEIHSGEKFGEEDLICGCARRATVITRHEVELLFLHRFDYMDIFNMSADSNDPKNLDICKQNVVLSHFPIQKLEENPGTWSTLRYKYGRLMVKDSNEVENIYVIKSGEARVMAYLQPGIIDVKARRKKVQFARESESAYHIKKKILNFIADRDYVRSSYTPNSYRPGPKRTPMSAPPVYGHRHCFHETAYKNFPSTPRPAIPTMSGFIKSKTGPMEFQKSVKLPRITLKTPGNSEEPLDGTEVIEEVEEKTTEEATSEEKAIVLEEISEIAENKIPFYQQTGDNAMRPQSDTTNKSTAYNNGQKSAKKKYKNAPFIKPRPSHVCAKKETKTHLPPFVQVETLHQGATFGLRSCLDPEDRGPSVSLVSGDCEVLAINKKFFLKHCDDAMYSLIRLKAKPFPTQGELIDRLDITMQWDEFRKETVSDFLKHKELLAINKR